MALIPVTDILSQDQDSFKVQVNGNYDSRGYNSSVSVFGDAVTGERVDDVSVKFQYNVSDFDTSSTVTGTGTIGWANSKASITTGAGIGSADLRSRDIVRYRPGHEAYGFFTAAFTVGETNTTQRAGLFDVDNGFWFGYNDGVFGVGYRSGAVDTHIPQNTWNGDQLLTSPFILDPTKMNIYKISYGWLGIAPIVFEVSCDNGKNWTVVHRIDLRNTQTSVSVENPMFPIRIEAQATGAHATPMEVTSASWNGGNISGRINDTAYVDRYFSIDAGIHAVVAGVASNILTVRNPATYQGKTNHVKSQLMLISAAADGGKPIQITTYKNATVGGTPAFNDVSTGNSQLQFDTVGTNFISGTKSFPFVLGKDESKTLYVGNMGLFLQPGEDVTFVAESTQDNDLIFAIRERSFF